VIGMPSVRSRVVLVFALRLWHVVFVSYLQRSRVCSFIFFYFFFEGNCFFFCVLKIETKYYKET